MTSKKYSTSFSVGEGFFYNESILIAELYLNLKDWQLVKNQVEEKNLMQARTRSTSGRYYREISARLRLLANDELQILAEGSHQQKSQIIWLAVCKCHQLLQEFAVEVIREKYMKHNMDLSLEDFNGFYNTKAEWQEELERLSISTRKKIQGSVFKILRKAGIITEQNRIVATVFSPDTLRVIRDNSLEYLPIYPTSEI
jgi:hypothetical protein